MTGAGLVWLAASARWFGLLGAHLLFARAVGAWWAPVSAALSLALGALVGGPLLAADPTLLPRAAALAVEAAPAKLTILLALEAGLGAVVGAFVSLPAAGALGVSEAYDAPRPGRGAALRPLVGALVIAVAMATGVHHAALAAFTRMSSGVMHLAPATWLGAGLDPVVLIRHLHEVLVLALALCAPVWVVRATVELLAGTAVAANPDAATASRAVASGLAAGLALLALFASVESYPAAWGRALYSAPTE